MKKEIFIEIISYAFFVLFLYTGLSKLASFDIYVRDLNRSPYLDTYAPLISIFVPAAELIVAGLLLSKKTRQYGLLGSLVLMFFFSIYVFYIVLFTTHRPCTCGGIIRQLSWPNHLIFNLSFLLLAIWGFLLQTKRTKEYIL